MRHARLTSISILSIGRDLKDCDPICTRSLTGTTTTGCWQCSMQYRLLDPRKKRSTRPLRWLCVVHT